MVLLYMLYMVTWIPSIYPSHIIIYTSTMDPSWVTSLAICYSDFPLRDRIFSRSAYGANLLLRPSVHTKTTGKWGFHPLKYDVS